MPTFVDFYRQHGISPVGQDISDLGRHFSRRESLYRSLGIAPVLVGGRRLIEFGPGSGYNALYTASLQPQRYVLVDGNPTGLDRARTLLESAVPAGATELAFVLSLAEEYHDDERYDIVLCEGTIPFQRDPGALARVVAGFARPGGIVVVTCIDDISFLAETLRRLLASYACETDSPLETKLAALRPVFAPHLAALSSASRPLDDWLLDNIIQLLPPPGFSIPQAIAALGDAFEIYGTSPRFLTDWRWYKALVGAERRFDERAIAGYYASALNLLDHTLEAPVLPRAFGEELAARCAAIVRQIADADARCERLDAALLARRIGDLRDHVAPHAENAARSLDAFARFLGDRDVAALNRSPFVGFFGRGQQYASFIRSA